MLSAQENNIISWWVFFLQIPLPNMIYLFSIWSVAYVHRLQHHLECSELIPESDKCLLRIFLFIHRFMTGNLNLIQIRPMTQQLCLQTLSVYTKIILSQLNVQERQVKLLSWALFQISFSSKQYSVESMKTLPSKSVLAKYRMILVRNSSYIKCTLYTGPSGGCGL